MFRTIVDKYMSIVPGAGVAAFDPATLTAISIGSTVAGAGISAASTIAGGNQQQQAANYEAAQITSNAGQAIASSQAKMLDTQQRTRLAVSRATAQAGASGVDAGVGSPASDTAGLARRGTYQSMIDLFNGQNEATADLNRAAAVRYSGDVAKAASIPAALATIAGAGGQIASTYGRYRYPAMRGGYG